jgi:hypothetical protein
MEKLILSLIFIVINIVLAYIDARRIKQGKRIYHGINGAVYAGLTFIAYLFVRDLFIIPAMLVLRIQIFNSSLNLFRGLPITYISKTTTSIIDRLTYGIVERLGYFTYCSILLVVTLILLCL